MFLKRSECFRAVITLANVRYQVFYQSSNHSTHLFIVINY